MSSMEHTQTQNNVELENLHLKEALQYAQRGWQDALALLQSKPEPQQGQQSSLEIRSLQSELDAAHKSMLQRTQQLSIFEGRLAAMAHTMEAHVGELKAQLRFPDPSEEEIEAAKLQHPAELSHGLDHVEDKAFAALDALLSQVQEVRKCSEFIRVSAEPFDNGEPKPHRPVAGKKAVTKKKVAAKK